MSKIKKHSFNYNSYNYLHELLEDLDSEVFYFRMCYSLELETALLHFLDALRKEIRRKENILKNYFK